MTKFTPQSYTILAIDDSPVTLRMVETALQQAGFDVVTAPSGEEGLEYIRKYGLPHLAIVDINMPFGMDGLEFCEMVLGFSDLPIIMLTAVEEIDIVIQAIEQYAEDYITKPVSSGELVARVRRILRGLGDFAFTLERYTRVDDMLAIDFGNCEALVCGRPIRLTPTETKLLYILMRNAGKLTPADFMLKRLWPMENAFEDRLRVFVHRARNKIEPDPQKPKYIVSQRSRGYIFLPNST